MVGYFTDGETGAQREKVTCVRSRSSEGQSQGLGPDFSGSLC